MSPPVTLEFISQGRVFLPFRTIHGVPKARMLEWFAIPFSSGPHFARSLPQGLELEVLHQDVGRAVPPWEAPGENPSSPLPLPGSRHSPWLHRSSFCLCLHMAFSASVSSFPSPVKTLQIRLRALQIIQDALLISISLITSTKNHSSKKCSLSTSLNLGIWTRIDLWRGLPLNLL